MVLHHPGPSETDFLRPGVFWMDLCLTPRRPQAIGRYVDRWGPHRSSDLGSMIALPPGEHLHLRNTGGRHASVVLQLRAEAVEKWLPEHFDWTDRRLEACLHIASDKLRTLMLWLYHELGAPTGPSSFVTRSSRRFPSSLPDTSCPSTSPQRRAACRRGVYGQSTPGWRSQANCPPFRNWHHSANCRFANSPEDFGQVAVAR